MSIFKVDCDRITKIRETTFKEQGIYERRDLQGLLKSDISVIAPDTLVVAEEFGEWENSNRSIDLLLIDKLANLVVLELKRTEDGGHLELQAIRYAAMISTLTFEKLIEIYDRYLKKNDLQLEAKESLLDFLDWEEPDEELFGQEVRIILASAGFSKEVTTAVMWLNSFGIDIRCVRMLPYANQDQLLLEIQTVIPLPEVSDYQVEIQQKRQKERESRRNARDFRKFDVIVAGKTFLHQNKRNMMFTIVSEMIRKHGIAPNMIVEAVPPHDKKRLFRSFDGELTADQVHDEITNPDSGGTLPPVKRYFCDEGQILYSNEQTYVLTNQWGTSTLEAARSLARAFPALGIQIDDTTIT